MLAIASLPDEWVLAAVLAATAEVVVGYTQINQLEIVKKPSLGDHESTGAESQVFLPAVDMMVVLHDGNYTPGSQRNLQTAAVALIEAVAAVGSQAESHLQ